MFKFDAEYETNEEKYGAIKTELLGDDSGKYKRKVLMKMNFFWMNRFKGYIRREMWDRMSVFHKNSIIELKLHIMLSNILM